jgi:hypothetical protein
MKDTMVMAAYDNPDPAADVQCDGATDTVRIQAAIDKCQSAANTPLMVFMGGTYLLKDTLWFGYDFEHKGDPYNPFTDEESPAGRMTVPSIDAPSGRACFRWAGNVTDKYMMAYSPRGGGAMCTFIRNLYLFADHKARGIFVGKATYGMLLDRMVVFATRGVGIDLFASWGLRAEGLSVWGASGYALRADSWNGGTCLDLEVLSCKAGDWPTDRPLIPHAAVAVWNSSGGDFIGTQLESSNYGADPLTYFYATAKGLVNVRIEDCQSLHPLVFGNSKVCTVERVCAQITGSKPEHLIEFAGGSRNAVRQVWATGMSGSVVGGATGNSVSGIIKA